MAGDTGNCRRHLVDSTLMDLLRLIIRHFDHWLSHVEGVEPFTDDSQCILRIQIGRINHDLTFPDQIIRSDTCALFLHFWNEHMPIIPDEGANSIVRIKTRTHGNSFHEIDCEAHPRQSSFERRSSHRRNYNIYFA